MRTSIWLALAVALGFLASVTATRANEQKRDDHAWISDFHLDKDEISTIGRNPHFMSETVRTPAAQFTNCLKVEETTPLDPGNKEYKYYAAGIGLVQDGALKLVKHGRTE